LTGGCKSVYYGAVNPTDAPRPIVVFIDDPRSRTVCSALLRHEGYGVFEATDETQAIEVAREVNAQLVLADLAPEPREHFHQRLLDELPGVTCLFVHKRDGIDSYTRCLGVPSAARDGSTPRN
jgi:CheY-like chemotaxis protein